MFTAEGQQLFRPEMYADTGTATLYKAYAQPGIARTVSLGIVSETADFGAALAANGKKALSTSASNMLDNFKLALDNPPLAYLRFMQNDYHSIRTVATETIAGTMRSMKETPVMIGEFTAYSTEPLIKNKLNDIYGNDVGSAVNAIAALRATNLVLNVTGATKVVTVAGKATVVQIEKQAAELASKKAAADIAEQEAKAAAMSNNFYRDGVASPQSLKTSSGIVIQANPLKTTTVLGTYLDDTASIISEQTGRPKNLNYTLPKIGGFNLLNTPDDLYAKLGPAGFWKQVNEPFLEAAVKRNDDIYLATRPSAATMLRATEVDGLSGFGREVNYLKSRGYIYDPVSGKMCLGGCK